MKIKKLVAPVLSLTLLIPTGIAAAAPANSMQPSVSTPAADLRAGLDQLLSEHFALAVVAMTKAYEGSKDAAAAYKALDQNALDMGPAIEGLYGKAGADEFLRIFRAHNKATDDYAKAYKMNNVDAEKAAKANVQAFVDEFSAFLATATAGNLPKDAAAKAIRLHEDQVQMVFDEYVAGDYKDAYSKYREGYKTMFVISKALSTAITKQMPEKFNNTTPDTKAADLRSSLNALVSEHVALSVLQMQKQLDGSKDSDALISTEAMNTADWKAAIGSLYGTAGADGFEKLWVTNHINAQSDYVNAVKMNDANAKAAVKSRIESFTKDFGAFLGTATNGNLPAAAATEALMKHEGQIQAAFDQYAAGNYDGAYATDREGFKFVFGVGQALGNAIVTQSPEKFMETPVVTPAPTPTPAPAPEMTTVWMKLNSMMLKVNGSTTQMDTTPVMWNGMTYIPLRFLSEGIGATVSYDKATKGIWVMAGSDKLGFWAGKDIFSMNGVNKKVSSKVVIDKNGRTLVPLRFIAETLNWNVMFNSKDGSITLTSNM
ncbi:MULTISPECIES: copper amine oxidase N-terminal domain-containing protein [unclassified Paenibacillus]|uniref:copper amine oxidase N-terminal domain-containing protein n=1 Tax=unclassified Paenibacillus TaxID=185978 RepID=UPI00095451BB|nr:MULTISPECIES: copper amine oxidase N-terminal domain-containing protein [unclassified Paenibacillus]ASS68394.1 copper amine oxidase N-terminal domain-containing protein [Paenibacillus sp. RUD330]SIR31840.1 Copper amine oxidase N-terminal domain-containing protein [Paenibacillus sp. RU4X]SIR43175.1 Copper amine oxidase N-terminal domain-containing protein [Paenibacillus sp. RU4T]